MLYPSISKLIDEGNSRYDVVCRIAKRARQISDTAERDGIPLEENAVKLALYEIDGKKNRAIDREARAEEKPSGEGDVNLFE